MDEAQVFGEIVESTRIHLSTIKPSEWYEQNMVMPRGSAFPGPFSFDLTPYWREPLDCVAKDHPAKEITIMAGAQIGKTAAVLLPIVGYTISQNPGNMMFLTGHSDLSEAAFIRIDDMITNCGLRHLMGPHVIKAKNSRSGDTNKSKEFPGGILVGGSVTNHNLLRQYDVMVMIVDDFDAAPISSKKAGATRELVQKRTSAFAHKKKIVYVSSPQLKGQSNIEITFDVSDKRFYHVHCPLCHKPIVLKWKIQVDEKESAGIVWDYDENGNLNRKSVGYVCQECAGFFNDTSKYEMNINGFWKPSVIPREENHFGYHISSLYSPPGMDDWAHYVQQYINANPPEGRPIPKKNQTFFNVVLGETYEDVGEAPEASILQKNIRPYEIGVLPESLSIADGNGKIILLTCACDLNGTEQDARLDYEIKAWAESGVSYSVKHGSIGTFVPRETAMKHKADRERWTYFHYKERSVWPELRKIINDVYKTDTNFPLPDDVRNIGRPMRIALTGIDTGHYTQFAYEFIDSNPKRVIGIKGDKESRYRKFDMDSPSFKPSKERGDLYLLDVNFIKDQLAERMKLVWDRGNEKQPFGFMNFPTPSGGLYLYQNYFEHYQSEHKVSETKDGEVTGFRWVKQTSNSQNHFWDVACYNEALRDIIVDQTLKEFGIRKGTWHDFVKKIIPK